MRAALVIVFLLAACERVPREGPDEQGYLWQKDGPVGKPVVHVVPDGNIFLYCGLESEAKSCAVIREGVCDIYLPEGYAAWQEKHEKKHCEGWTHPNPLKQGI